jgi:ubiquitin-conjugating enzyme E2 variant
MEISAIGLFGCLTAGLGWKLVATLNGPPAWIAFGASVLVGYAFADLATGIAHWLADRYGTVATPIVGPNFIRPFREHHSEPKAIVDHDFVETNGSNCIVTAPWMALVFFSLELSPSLPTTFLLGGTLAFCLSIFATNQFHKWAHMDAQPGLVKLLGKFRLILTPEHHDVHHSAPFDRNYCITVGWWNPLLERTQLFPRIEAGLTFLTGVQPAEASREFPQAESRRIGGAIQFEQDLRGLL